MIAEGFVLKLDMLFRCCVVLCCQIIMGLKEAPDPTRGFAQIIKELKKETKSRSEEAGVAQVLGRKIQERSQKGDDLAHELRYGICSVGKLLLLGSMQKKYAWRFAGEQDQQLAFHCSAALD